MADVRNRLLIPLLTLSLLAAACGDDGDAADDGGEVTTTTAATTTTATDGDVGDDDGGDDGATTTTTEGTDDTTTTTEGTVTTTTEATVGPTGTLSSGSVTTADGLEADWELSTDGSQLCFDAVLSHPDPDQAAIVGPGVSNCLATSGGLDAMETGLSVDVGTLDGDKTIGYLWGRAAAGVIRLTIEHNDGSQSQIELLDGPTEVQVFAYVVDTSTIPGVVGLDAISGEGIEGSAEIRDFLRSGPTYPTVPTTTTVTTPDYPTS